MRIGVCVPFLGGFYFSGFLQAVQQIAAEFNVSLVAIRTGSRGSDGAGLALDAVDGWIVVLDAVSGAWCAEAARRGQPVVCIGHRLEHPATTEIRSDNRAGIQSAMQALYDAGHRCFGFLGHVVESDVIERLVAFHEFLAAHELAPESAPVIHSDAYTFNAGYQAAEKLLALAQRPTALITSNDQNAAGAIDCLLDAGIAVPQDIAVIGYDNAPLSRAMQPPIASIDQNFPALARCALETLVARLAGTRAAGGRCVVPTRFISRASAGLPPAEGQIDLAQTVPLARFEDTLAECDEFSPFLHAGMRVDTTELLGRIAAYASWALYAEFDGLALTPNAVVGGASWPRQLLDHALDARVFPSEALHPGFAAAAGELNALLPIWHDGQVTGLFAIAISPFLLARPAGMLALAHALELLTCALGQSLHSRQLEDMVQQRTNELRTANRELQNTLTQLRRQTDELTANIERMRQMQHELVEAEKLASLGRLVAGVAHELNTPIGNALVAATAIENRLGELRPDFDSGRIKRSQLAEFLDQTGQGAHLLVRACSRAAALITSFKQVAVDQASERRRDFNLAHLVQDNLAALQPSLRGVRWTLRVEIAEDL
jgi:DNA-binding LacI/PurR family transcriptional regulator/signal transduction histidine kinase